MKKLESLENERFKISEEELLQIKGGYGTPTSDQSYTFFYTHTGNNGTVMDKQVSDACVDW